MVPLAIKVDVDTERATRIGVPNLLRVFDAHGIRATFLFSLGAGNTPRGVRAFLNGVLGRGLNIGRGNEGLLRSVRDAGHEVGILQDGCGAMTRDEVLAEFARAREEFERIFGEPARVAGAAGRQANAFSLEAYDSAGLAYASDARGSSPFLPRVEGRVFLTPQIPTTLPTLDELLGRPDCPLSDVGRRYLGWMHRRHSNVLTIHADVEGIAMLRWWRAFLARTASSVRCIPLREVAASLTPASLPVCDLRGSGNRNGAA